MIQASKVEDATQVSEAVTKAPQEPAEEVGAEDKARRVLCSASNTTLSASVRHWAALEDAKAPPLQWLLREDERLEEYRRPLDSRPGPSFVPLQPSYNLSPAVMELLRASLRARLSFGGSSTDSVSFPWLVKLGAAAADHLDCLDGATSHSREATLSSACSTCSLCSRSGASARNVSAVSGCSTCNASARNTAVCCSRAEVVGIGSLFTVDSLLIGRCHVPVKIGGWCPLLPAAVSMGVRSAEPVEKQPRKLPRKFKLARRYKLAPREYESATVAPIALATNATETGQNRSEYMAPASA